MKIEEARKYLLVDTDDLNKECRVYSSIYDMIGQEYFKAISIRDSLKETADRLWSRLFVEIKEASGKSDKMTEAMVDIDKDYIGAYQTYLDSKLEADNWYSVKESFDKKAHFIKELCEFFLSGVLQKMEVSSKEGSLSDVAYEEKRKMLKTKRNKI